VCSRGSFTGTAPELPVNFERKSWFMMVLVGRGDRNVAVAENYKSCVAIVKLSVALAEGVQLANPERRITGILRR
jgi:hypothetical protein